MPFLGHGSSVGHRSPDLANFPQTGLVALYKCDERSGDRFVDATGNLSPILLSTGVALDCTTNAQYVVDATGLRAALNGRPAYAVFAAEFFTPALVTNGTAHRIIAGNGTTSTNAPGLQLTLTESNSYGSAANKFSVTALFRLSREGGAVANTTFTFGASVMPGLAASTHYQIVGQLVTDSGVQPYVVLRVRSGPTGAWSEYTVAGGTAGTAHTIVDGSTSEYRVGASASGTDPFKGKILSVLYAGGEYDLDDAVTVLNTQDKTFAQATFDDAYGRFWVFRDGTGSNARELLTDVATAITGTVTWGTSLAGCTQQCTAQGGGYYGKAGGRFGGEASYSGGGGGANTAAGSQIISSPDGWTVLAMLRTGNRIPAAEQVLVSVYGLDGTGSAGASLVKRPGVHMTLTAAGLIYGRVKRYATGDDTGDGSAGTLGATADGPLNGLLTAYAISCNTSGVVQGRRFAVGDSSVTTASTIIAANTANLANRADRIQVAGASFDGDLVVGFIAIYNRHLSDAEIIQCHRIAYARMNGQPIYVNSGLSLYGNGTLAHPYSDTTPAMRTAQPNQVVNLAAGTYKRISNNQPAALLPSSNENIWLKGASNSTTIIQADASGTGNHPAEIASGSWRFSDIKFDARDISYNAFTTGAVNDVESLIFDRCWFYDAKAGSQTGTGLVTRALYVEINDCISSHNGEHGVYLRVASTVEGDHQAIVRGLYCHDNTEDGLKFAADTTSPDMETKTGWDSCIVDRVKVDGGKNQLWISGVKNSVVTNCLLLNKSDTGLDTGALYLGYPIVSGTTENEDFCDNNTIANITIYNASGAGVLDARSTGTTIQNLICSGGDDDLVVDDDGTAVITYAAGDADSNKLPTHDTNIVDATIAFTNAAGGDYTLTALSDGYGDGVNLYNLSNEINSDYAGTARPVSGAWNMGAY